MSTDTHNEPGVSPQPGEAQPHANAKRERQKARRAERLEAQATQDHRSKVLRTLRIALASIIAVGLLGWLGWTAIQGTDPTLGVAGADVAADAVPLVPVPQSGVTDPAIGATAPLVQGQDFDGSPVQIGQPGQAHAVVFVAHWCPHCQEEMPLIAGWVGEGLLPEDVQLVAVSTYHDPARPNWPPDEWFTRESFPGAVLSDPTETAAKAWALSGTPMWVFTNDQGLVVARYSGQITAEQFAEGAGLAAGDART